MSFGKRRAQCHIQSAYPETGPDIPTLCGRILKHGSYGGIASATCIACLTTAVRAGHLTDMADVVPGWKKQVTGRLREMGILDLAAGRRDRAGNKRS